MLLGRVGGNRGHHPGGGGGTRNSPIGGAIASFWSILVDWFELLVWLELDRAFFLMGVNSGARLHFERSRRVTRP